MPRTPAGAFHATSSNPSHPRPRRCMRVRAPLSRNDFVLSNDTGALGDVPGRGFSGHWRGEGAERMLCASLGLLHRRGIQHVFLAGLSNGAVGASAMAPIFAPSAVRYPTNHVVTAFLVLTAARCPKRRRSGTDDGPVVSSVAVESVDAAGRAATAAARRDRASAGAHAIGSTETLRGTGPEGTNTWRYIYRALVNARVQANLKVSLEISGPNRHIRRGGFGRSVVDWRRVRSDRSIALLAVGARASGSSEKGEGPHRPRNQ